MNFSKLTVILLALYCVLPGCKKGGDEEPETCEDTRIVKVTFTNNASQPLRVVLSTRLTPQFVPIEPIFSQDLAPGASLVKEIEAERYVVSWYEDCATECSIKFQPFRTYETCGEYTENPAP